MSGASSLTQGNQSYDFWLRAAVVAYVAFVTGGITFVAWIIWRASRHG